MEDSNFNVLVDAKTEYTKQLVNMLKQNIYHGIKSIYDDSKKYCHEKSEPQNILKHFQVLLSYIPKWNQEIIEEETNRIIHNTNCDWLEDLITAVFVSHTRILTSINTGKNKKKIDLKIPKVSNFIHKVYIDIARNFWKNAYLFNDSVNKCEYQRNRREAELIIETSINETIRKQLPVKHILREYLGNEYEEEDDTELIDDKINTSNNLRKMVKLEIDNCSNEKLNKIKQELNLENIENQNLEECKNQPDKSENLGLLYSKKNEESNLMSTDNTLEDISDENKETSAENKLDSPESIKDSKDTKNDLNSESENIFEFNTDDKTLENKDDKKLNNTDEKLLDTKPDSLLELNLDNSSEKDNSDNKNEDSTLKELDLELNSLDLDNSSISEKEDKLDLKTQKINSDSKENESNLDLNLETELNLDCNDTNTSEKKPLLNDEPEKKSQGLNLEIKDKDSNNLLNSLSDKSEISDDELDNILDTEIDNLSNSSNDLQIESLNLDDIDDLSTLKEVYVDDVTTNKSNDSEQKKETFTELKSNNEAEKSEKSTIINTTPENQNNESNIKKIVIDSSNNKKKVYKSDEISLDDDFEIPKKLDSRKNIKFFDN